jgi:hypothetical protein
MEQGVRAGGPDFWTVELDDGGGADRTIALPAPVSMGETIDAFDRRWVVDRVEAERGFAHANLSE